MLGHAMISRLFDYNDWANERILACAEKVSDEQWRAPTDHSHGSLHQTLYHMLTVEWGWRNVCEHHAPPESGPSMDDLATVEALRAFKNEESKAMRRFLAGLSDADLAASTAVNDRELNTHSLVLWEMLVHINHHSAQHRSEAAAILTGYGQSPGDIDYIYYITGDGASAG